MNKIFKVVWSKTKECYVVVSEVAKNNGGKKKVLASVLATLAMVGAGAQVQAYSGLGGHDNPAVETLAVGPDTWANQEAAVAVGMHNNANGQPAGKHSVAIGSFSNANGEISIAMGGVTNASGKMSVAVGYRASATDEAAVALGNMVSADKNSTGVGPGATASGTYAFAGGYQSETTGISGVAIGDNAKAKAARAMAIGGHAEATAEQAIAIGSDTGAGTATTNKKTTASGKNAIAVGNGSKATTNDSLAMGSSAEAAGLNASAVGKNSKASGQSAAAFGDSAQATNTNATAVGNKANASNTNTTAIGNQTVASGGNATAVGHLSQATDDGATAIGTNNKAGYEGTAVGLSNTVTGRTSAAFGRSNTVSGNESIAAGIRSTASGEHNVAIGYQAVTNNKATVAIGEGSKADIADGVAIGSNSATTAAAGVQGFNPADSRTKTYGGLTGAAQTSTLGAVAVGNGDTATRQITGLAAGKENTDAVNVAQLRSVNLKYAADTGNSDFLLTDGTLTVKGDNDLISTSVESTGAIKVTAKKGGNITHTDGKAVKPTTNGIATTDNVVDAINDSYWKATAGGNTVGTVGVGNVKPGNKVTFSAGDNLKVKQSLNNTTGEQEYTYSLNPVLTGITSITNTAGGPTMTFGGNSINITGGSLNMGNNKITNLATGTDDKDAVNVKQLKDTEIHITPGTYTPDSNKKVTLTYENADNKTVTGKTAVIDLSGLATGGTSSTEKVKKAANGANDTNIAEVNPQTGDTYGAADATYEVSVSRNAVKDAAREAVTVNNGGTTTGGTYTADTNNPISVTATPDNTNHNTTYAVTFDGNKAAKQIPLTYKATNGTTTTADQTVKLDKGLNFTGGDYTTASVGADGKVTFDVNLGTTPTVTDGKPSVPGQAGAAGKDGIATVKTVVDTINNSGWKANAKANGGSLDGNSTATVVKPGDQVNFAAGKNLTVKQDLTGEHTYTYSLNKDLKDLTSVEIGGSTIKTDGDHITITSPDTTTGATPGATVTNKVANLGDEKHIKPDTYAVANDGSVTLKYVDGNGKDLTETTKITGIAKKAKVINGENTTVEEGTDAVDNSTTYKVNVKGDLTGISSITNGGTNNGKISFGPNKTVTVDGDHSITLNASTGTIGGLQNKTFDPTNITSGQAATEDQLKSVHDTLKANELHIAPTETDRTGEHIAGGATGNTASGAATNAYKYDATTKQVVLEYNDGNGTNKTGTKAVIDLSNLPTGGDMSSFKVTSSAESTTVGTHAGDASQEIKNGKSVDFQAGKNMTVTQSNDNGNTVINYALDKNLNGINTIKNGNTTITLNDTPNATTPAVTITGGNLSVDDNKITNVANGDVNSTSKDAVNGSQLYTVDQKFNNKINLGADGNTETTKLALDNNGGIKFNIKGDGSGTGGANQYISTTANGSDIKVDLTDDAKAKLNKSYDVTSTDNSVTVKSTTTNGVTTFDLKVAPATGTTSTWDIKSSADTANGGATATGHETNAKTIANTNSVEMIAGKNLTVKQTSDTNGAKVEFALSDEIAVGKDGANGVDGKIGVNGKDGASVVINGKDGSIGLTGVPGIPGTPGTSATLKVKDGVPGVDGAPGTNLTRIVYTDKNNVEHEVATHDDGMKFAGDDGQTNQATNANVIKKHLNNVVDIIGGATKADLTTNNIGVNNDGNGKLLVQLSKNLNGINTIKNGNTTITLNDAPGGATNTPAVTISGGDLSVGGNKVTNVDDGTDNNDAVNVKQLKAAKTEVEAGKNVVVTSKTSTTDGHTTYTVNASTPAVYTKPNGDKLIKQPDGTFKEENGTAYNGPVIASFEDGTGATTGGNMIVNNIGSAIKNQTGGDFLAKLDAAANTTTGTPNAAVNVSDLKSTADALKANERHIAPTTVAAGSTETKGGTANAAGTNVYKYDAASKTVTLTYNDGNGNAVTDTKAVIDLSNLSTGGTGASSWNIASDKVSATEGAVATGSAGTQNIADGKTVTMKAGKNLTVNQVNDGAGNASVAFSLDKNLENLDKVVVNGNDGATGQAGVSIVGPKGANGVDGNDGKVGITGKDGKDAVSISGKDGVGHIGLQGPKGTPGTPGADGASLDISTDHGTQTLTKPEANNGGKSERIVYVPKDANGNPLKDTDGNDIKREVATMDDGLRFTGNNTGTENKRKLGSLVKVQGEGVTVADEAAFQSASGNIAVTADGTDTLTIRLNKNLKGLNSIQLGDNTIKSNGDNIEFTTKGGDTKTVATTDQLWTIQANGTDVPATNGKVNVVGKDGITVAKNAAGNLEISGTGLGTMNGFDVTANNGATSKTITDGKKVDFNAGSNLTVKQTSDANGTHIEYALKEAVDLGTNGSLKAGDTTVNKDGVTIANGPSITKTGVDAGDKKITNVADGDVNATSKDAVNGSQLKKYTDAAKTTVEAGDTNVKVETDNTAADGHTNYKVSLEPVVTIGDTHKVKIDGHTGDITGLTNVNLTDPTFATKGRAATEEQLDKVLTEAKKKAVEKVQAGTAAAGDTNIATVAPKAGDTFGAAGATYEVSVSKNAVKDAAKEAVKVTSASPAITVTADNTTPHETTYKVGFDGNQAATQIPLTYKQNGGNTRTVKLSDGLNFIDGTNTKARTAADGKVTFDVMGDLTGITSISNAAGGPKMTFGGNSINVTGGNLDMGGKKITNIGKGTDPTDAARVGQLTKVTSNNHSVVINKTTDADGAPVYDLAVTGTPGAPAADPRVDMLGEEIGRVGAQGAALSALKPIQYDPLEPTQIMAGYGNYRGNSALALGVAHYKNESTLIHGGVSWAGGSSHMMANAGVTWKVGNRDSEAAVADRYRKGPISSAYAMQQEMASVKAQNAGLKTEVSDLKAENEQMKAQIAAMMAKLGM